MATAQNVRKLEENQSVIVPFNDKGDKYVEFKVLDVEYSDSTRSCCNLKFNILIKSVGQKIKLGEFNGVLGSQDYFFGYMFDGRRYERLCNSLVVNKNDSARVTCRLRLDDGSKRGVICYLTNKLFSIPTYDGRVIEEKRRIEHERLQAEAKRAQDSIRAYSMPPISSVLANYELEIPEGYILPDTLKISDNKYGIKGKRVMKIVNFYGRCDTVYQDGLAQADLSEYNSAIKKAYYRSLPFENINDRNIFNCFYIGDSLQDFLSRLGTKKVHISDRGGYQITVPDALTKKPETFEFFFYDDKISKIERITRPRNTLPTNDIWTAFQLMQLKDELGDLEKATKRLRQSRKK